MIEKIRGRWKLLIRDRRGVAAIEFALILPILVTLYFGSVEVTQAVAASRKVTLVTRTVADLSSQVKNITAGDMNNILGATSTVAYPLGGTNLRVVVSAVTIDKDGIATVTWSATLNGTKRQDKQVVTSLIPEALRVAETQLIWSEVEYDYTPAVGYVMTGTITLKDKLFMRPRLSDKVIYPYTGS